MVERMSNRYQALLQEMCTDPRVKALIELARIEDKLQRDAFYREYGRYPEQRDVADMLYMDLILSYRNEISEKLEEDDE